MTSRTFEDRAAVRERVPLLVGLVGPSSSGKTFSALRLATGIQRVSGGEIFVVDTEARRALHYASDFDFRHVSFGAPFSPADYLSAIEHCASKGAGVIVVDSLSHEHEGPGGVLEMHDAEAKRLAQRWKTTEDKTKMAAWVRPKKERRRLINAILQTPCNFVLCFRAKPKMQVKRGHDPKELGYMPIAADELIFEMTINALLLPGARGVPSWHSDALGERAIIKRPAWADPFFTEGQPLNEETGAALARWAEGTAARDVAALLEALAACQDGSTLGAIRAEARAIYRSMPEEERALVKAAIEHATAQVRAVEVGGEAA